MIRFAPIRCAARAHRTRPISAALGAAALLLTMTASAQAATSWHSDPAHSRLTFGATQAGARFEGRFRTFDPQITFDPADLAHSRFTVTVDTGTAETQDRERDDTLRSKDFFDVAHWPKATFETAAFNSLGGGRYEATGKLTIRDATKPVKLVFTFTPGAGGASATLAGGTTIKRLDFGVGQGEWTDTTWVGNDVDIRFELTLNR
jgi:polyisoprenoid-binding protein YceI